jgi:hypothetical protein
VDEGHNEFGMPRLAPDQRRFHRARREMTDEPLVLSAIARKIVDRVMREHCAIRDWDLRSLAVRSNHVHTVIASPIIRPETIVKQLKDWGTRRLRSHQIVGPTRKVWADHGSMIYLFEPGSLERAIEYVREMQDGNEGREDWDVKLGLKEP